MLEKSRLKRRAQTKRIDFRIFGSTLQTKQTNNDNDDDENNQEHNNKNKANSSKHENGVEKELIPQGRPQSKNKEQNVDTEIFDDTDFYQLLLKEIVENSNEDETTLRQFLAPKIKRKVKRTGSSMSKNRRLK
jgi:hypothetical protein